MIISMTEDLYKRPSLESRVSGNRNGEIAVESRIRPGRIEEANNSLVDIHGYLSLIHI